MIRLGVVDRFPVGYTGERLGEFGSGGVGLDPDSDVQDWGSYVSLPTISGAVTEARFDARLRSGQRGLPLTVRIGNSRLGKFACGRRE
jgi:hypothetical protein